MNGLFLLSQGGIIGISVAAGVVVLLAIILIVWYISTYNKLPALNRPAQKPRGGGLVYHRRPAQKTV